MGNLGGGEILVILLIGLIVLGPTKLPDAARQVGRFATEIRKIGAGFQREMREAMQEPIDETKATLKAASLKPDPTVKPVSRGGPTDDAAKDSDADDNAAATQTGEQPASETEPLDSDDPT